MKNFVKLIQITLVAMACVAFVGCNTFRGMGRDIERAGEEIQEEATEAQH